MSNKWLYKDSDGNYIDFDYNEKTGDFIYHRAVDIAPILNENFKLQKDTQNGFFKESRTGRHIGEIPNIVYYRDVLPRYRQIEKEYSGEDIRIQKGKYLREFLNEHPEYRVVEKMVSKTSNSGNIIIK